MSKFECSDTLNLGDMWEFRDFRRTKNIILTSFTVSVYKGLRWFRRERDIALFYDKH